MDISHPQLTNSIQNTTHEALRFCSRFQKKIFKAVSTPCLLASSADNHFKQFGYRSGPTFGPDLSNLFDTLNVLLKGFFEKVDFENNHQTTKKHAKLTSIQRANAWQYDLSGTSLFLQKKEWHCLSSSDYQIACSCDVVII